MKKSMLFSAVFAIAATGCAKFEESAFPQEIDNAVASPHTRSTMYTQLQNPYALNVMQAVYDSLSPILVSLQPTDIYVRMKPQNAEQVELLQGGGFELFDYPLDIELPEGAEYVDPTIPEGEPTWLYTTIKPNETLRAR